MFPYNRVATGLMEDEATVNTVSHCKSLHIQALMCVGGTFLTVKGNNTAELN